MSHIGRLSLLNNKIDAIEQLQLTASNDIKSFHFVGNHLLDIPVAPDAINIRGIGERLVVNNHFPCDCRMRTFTDTSLFGNQSLDDVMDTNFCISPYEVHGQSLLAASTSTNSSLFDNCSDVSAASVTTAGSPLLLSPTQISQTQRPRPSLFVIYTTALFTLLKMR